MARRTNIHQVTGAFRQAFRKRSIVAFIVASLLLGSYFSDPKEAAVVGGSYVHDGDTLTVNGQKFRLFGVDAFELHQKCSNNLLDTAKSQEWDCGEAAKEHLKNLVGTQSVQCTGSEKSYDRIVATCLVGTVDLSEAITRAGYALAYRRYSTKYVPAEVDAKTNKRGAWASSFQNPWDWRKEAKGSKR